MDTRSLLRFLDFLNSSQVWLFTLQDAHVYFGESLPTLQASLRRHIKSTLICRITRNLYANPRSRWIGQSSIGKLVTALRPTYFNYLSLESVLSEHGAISQVCTTFTFMTTGRKGLFRTFLGTIEFNHTSNIPQSKQITWIEERSLWMASPQLAYNDFSRLRPDFTHDMVDLDDLDDAEDDFQRFLKRRMLAYV